MTQCRMNRNRVSSFDIRTFRPLESRLQPEQSRSTFDRLKAELQLLRNPHTTGSAHGSRYSTAASAFASPSQPKPIVDGSNATSRPSRCERLPRWHSVELSWPASMSAVGVLRDLMQSIKFRRCGVFESLASPERPLRRP